MCSTSFMDIVELNNTYESIVQLVEHVLAKNKVVGSMPIALFLDEIGWKS